MDQERRIFFHKPAVAGVRLYHPALDTTLQATIEEWSPAGVRIACETLNINGHDFGETYFQLEPDYMDVIFTMEFVRLDEKGIVLKFVDDGNIVAGDRL